MTLANNTVENLRSIFTIAVDVYDRKRFCSWDRSALENLEDAVTRADNCREDSTNGLVR